MDTGDAIDIWIIEKQLGSGGMGSVYRCHNRTATRILAAIKVLDQNIKKSAGAEERFIREAEILFQLDHPNIVKVRNIRTDTDPAYLEMEFVQGQSLDRRMEDGPVPLTEALDLMRQMADAVQYLHGRHIRHRDIKPANILIQPDGRLKLVDFGLAIEADTTRLTQAGVTFGTVSYAPPEWITPELLDPVKWDIYAMGVLFWEMLTGQTAFAVSGHGSARQQALQVVMSKQRHAPLDPGPAFQDDLRSLVQAMTHSDPDRRIGDASDVYERLLGAVPQVARPDLYASLPSIAMSAPPSPSENTWVDGGLLDPVPPPPKPMPRESSAGSTPAPDSIAPGAFDANGPKIALAVAVAGIALAVGGWWFSTRNTGDATVDTPRPTAAETDPKGALPATSVAPPGTPTPPATRPTEPPAPTADRPQAAILPPEPTRPAPPVTAPTAAAKSVDAPKIPEVAPAPTRSAGKWISRRDFSAWLAKHPDWNRDAAIARGAADPNYLSDWADGQPAAGTEKRPMVNVSWNAAAAYCRDRGGLAELDAEPLQWPETGDGAPQIEWRSADGRPAWRDNQGITAKMLVASTSLTGFRCKR